MTYLKILILKNIKLDITGSVMTACNQVHLNPIENIFHGDNVLHILIRLLQ